MQIWSWEHFAGARPVVRPGHPYEPLGGWDVEIRHAYGIRWSGPKRFFDQAKNALNVLRKQFQELMEGEIDWEPYGEFLRQDGALEPPIVYADRHLWMVRIGMIHFWTVKFHYPDQVMRQFGRSQLVPPPPPPGAWDPPC